MATTPSCPLFAHYQPLSTKAGHKFSAAVQMRAWEPGASFTLTWRECTFSAVTSTSATLPASPPSGGGRTIRIARGCGRRSDDGARRRGGGDAGGSGGPGAERGVGGGAGACR